MFIKYKPRHVHSSVQTDPVCISVTIGNQTDNVDSVETGNLYGVCGLMVLVSYAVCDLVGLV